MAKTTKLTVKTDVGTFTRSTARTYTHIVVVANYRAEVLEAQRLANLKNYREQVHEYSEVLAGNKTIGIRTSSQIAHDHDVRCREQFLAEGLYNKWLADAREKVTQLEAQGVITEDGGGDWGYIGWCGRLDLAQKLAATDHATNYRNIRVYALDGTEVRHLRRGK